MDFRQKNLHQTEKKLNATTDKCAINVKKSIKIAKKNGFGKKYKQW